MAFEKFINSLNPHLRKLIRNYNVIERADKSLKQEKRDVSPRHPGTKQLFDVVVKSSPEIKEKILEKKEDLLERLKEMNIESSDVPKAQPRQGNLPQDRMSQDVPEFGYHDPSVIPEGKCSLKQALDFIGKHQNNSKEWTVKKIATSFTIKESDVQNVIDNFKVLELYYTEEKKKSIKDIALSTLGVGNVKQAPIKTKFEKSGKTLYDLEKQITDGEPKK